MPLLVNGKTPSQIRIVSEKLGLDTYISTFNINKNGVITNIWNSLPDLPDFVYEYNNGKCELTEWKGTLNGVSSTELVIPDDENIIIDVGG